MNPEDTFRLRDLRRFAEANHVSRETIEAIRRRTIRSVVATNSKHRTFLSRGVVAIFSIEDYGGLEPANERFRRREKVRHLSLSQQAVSGGRYLGNVVPSASLVQAVAHELGFRLDEKVRSAIFPSPDDAGPLIQHVLEDLEPLACP